MGSQHHLVLVVEDEALIRMMVADALHAEGVEVIELASGDDALRVIQGRPGVKAIFTDINMPGKVDGLGLVKFVEQNFPGIAIFVTSGKPLSENLPQRARFYPKPYHVGELVEAIKDSTA